MLSNTDTACPGAGQNTVRLRSLNEVQKCVEVLFIRLEDSPRQLTHLAHPWVQERQQRC